VAIDSAPGALAAGDLMEKAGMMHQTFKRLEVPDGLRLIRGVGVFPNGIRIRAKRDPLLTREHREGDAFLEGGEA
jgi:hypothetical protein